MLSKPMIALAWYTFQGYLGTSEACCEWWRPWDKFVAILLTVGLDVDSCGVRRQLVWVTDFGSVTLRHLSSTNHWVRVDANKIMSQILFTRVCSGHSTLLSCPLVGWSAAALLNPIIITPLGVYMARLIEIWGSSYNGLAGFTLSNLPKFFIYHMLPLQGVAYFMTSTYTQI